MKESPTTICLVFGAPFNKGKPQGRVDVGTYECAFLQGKETSENTMLKIVEVGKQIF